MGLYTQQDPIGIAGGLNLYGYANGDPVNFSDPFGLCPDEEDPECTRVQALLIFDLNVSVSIGAVGFNVEAGFAISMDSPNAVAFARGGPTIGMGYSVGPEVGVMAASLNDFGEMTGRGGGGTVTLATPRGSVTPTFSGESPALLNGVKFGGPGMGFLIDLVGDRGHDKPLAIAGRATVVEWLLRRIIGAGDEPR